MTNFDKLLASSSTDKTYETYLKHLAGKANNALDYWGNILRGLNKTDYLDLYPKLVLYCCKRDPLFIRNLERHQITQEVANICKEHYSAKEYVPIEYLSDSEINSIMVRSYTSIFGFVERIVKANMKRTDGFWIRLIKINSECFKAIPLKRQTISIVEAALDNDPNLIVYVRQDLKSRRLLLKYIDALVDSYPSEVVEFEYEGLLGYEMEDYDC